MSDSHFTTTVPAPPDSDPFWGSPPHGQVKEWLQGNGIDLRIPRRDITVTGPPGDRTIQYTGFVLAADGHIQSDASGEPLTEKRAAPCLVEPPAAVTKEAA
ncbi:hypothetical protein OG786_29530 [Streptomyces sp. NBC_00101]|uniref:hypothetical protein n=1 Tax=Streptomyces sp. NBC_00101 TaxID=2975651 RepID=UPI0032550727